MRALSTTLLSELISSKLSGKDGCDWVSCSGWTEENGASGGINKLKPFITADTIPCQSSGNIGKLRAEANKFTGGGWLDPFLVSSSISTPSSIFVYMYIRILNKNIQT